MFGGHKAAIFTQVGQFYFGRWVSFSSAVTKIQAKKQPAATGMVKAQTLGLDQGGRIFMPVGTDGDVLFVGTAGDVFCRVFACVWHGCDSHGLSRRMG